MDRKDFAAWCQAATKKIRYGPDREMVSRELRDHLEDHCDALIAQGMPPEAAAQKALEAMGSAESIAPQLAAIHRPWLGWVFSTVRFVAIVMAIYAVIFSLVSGYFYLTSWINMFGNWEEKGIYEAISSNDNVTYFAEPNIRASIDGHQLCVSEVAVIRVEADIPVNRLLIAMKITNWPWNYGFKAGDYFWALDSVGNYYPSNQEWTEDAKGIRYISTGSSSVGLDYRVFDILYFDSNAEWIELCYDRDGRNLVFHIDLSGGDGE